MTAKSKQAPAQPGQGVTFLRKHLLLIIGAAAGIIATFFVTNTMFDGSFEKMTGTPTWQNILLVNLLVGACILLFVVELKRQAIRVLLTVIVALLLGFLVTFIFNLDSAERFGRGEFRVQVVSDSEPVENDEVDLEYNKRRGGDFNKPNVVAPVSEVAWTFAGGQGDVVSLLAYAKNRRSEVDLLVELRDASGAVLAAAESASELQVDETFDDLVSVKRRGHRGLRPAGRRRLHALRPPGRYRDGHGALGGAEPVAAGFRGAAAGAHRARQPLGRLDSRRHHADLAGHVLRHRLPRAAIQPGRRGAVVLSARW